MTANWILGWWNLIYVLPFGLALLYLGLYTLTGIGGDADADADVDADADLDAEADLGADAAGLDAEGDVEVDHDVDVHHDLAGDVDADHDADVSHAHVEHGHDTHGHGHGHGHGAGHHKEVPLHASLLSLIGVGRAPVGVVLIILLMTWGLIGFVTNQVVRPIMPYDWMVALPSLPLALFGSVMITGTIARLVARALPTGGATAARRRELAGSTGVAMYDITKDFGMAMVRDAQGNRFQIPCRVGVDKPTIAKGESVLLIRYDAEADLFIVMPDELSSVKRRVRLSDGIHRGDAEAAEKISQ